MSLWWLVFMLTWYKLESLWKRHLRLRKMPPPDFPRANIWCISLLVTGMKGSSTPWGCHTWMVALGAVRRQAEKTSKQHPQWPLHQHPAWEFLSCWSSDYDFLQWLTVMSNCELKWALSFPSCFHSWCFIPHNNSKPKTVTWADFKLTLVFSPQPSKSWNKLPCL